MIIDKESYEFNEYIKLVSMTASGAIIEVICFADSGHLYAGVMTGNTIQLGINIWDSNWWATFPLIWVIGFFAFGCIVGQVIKVKFKEMRILISHFIILFLLCISSVLHFHIKNLIIYEVPLFSISIAIQAVNLTSFDGVNLQTIVTTNNIVKFMSGLVSKILFKDEFIKNEDIYLPLICWVTFITSSIIGGYFHDFYNVPLILPIIIHFSYLTSYLYKKYKNT